MKRFRKTKNLIALLLAAVMIASPAVTALAQGITLDAENSTVKAGEQVKVTVKLDEEIKNISAGEIRVQYDEDLFTFDLNASEEGSSDITIKEATAKKDSEPAYVPIGTIFIKGGTLSANQVLATLAFTAKQDIAEQKLANFASTVFYMEQMDGTQLQDSFTNNPITVTVTPASAEAKGYSMEVSAKNPTVVVGEEAQVALKITNPDAASYNAYYAEVQYDTSILTYKSITPTDASVQDNNGTLKIAGYGTDRTCGAEDVVLTFESKATGDGKVTVKSAKVDAKANASEQNAPAATLTTAEATIKVGGHPVTLPDDFTGETTVLPGSDYTFTAKDTSKKYTFTATVNGEAVDVIDNGNGTYTVKNVNGPLVIKAEAQAQMVTIEETGNGWEDVKSRSWGSSGAQVKEGADDLVFMLQPKDSRTYTVTANGTVITGTPIQGGMMYRYAIPAELVKGEKLTINVTYTEPAADTITIIETGDAWGGLTNITRNGWNASGDEISADTGSCSLRFKFASGKTLDDFVITINGTVVTPRKSGPFYTFDFNASEVAKDGVITIDVSYKKTEPTYTVDVKEYLSLDGQTMYLVTASGDVAEGKVLAYDGNQMYWSEKYNEGKGAYAWLIIPDKSKTPDTLKEEAAKLVTAVDGTKISVSYNGDVNLTKAVDINDAQFVWNMYNAEYKTDTEFQTVNRLKYLSADVNGDGALNTTDAASIVNTLIK